MKKLFLILIALTLLVMPWTVIAEKPSKCTTIQAGVLKYSAGHYLAGHPLMTGYDPYGYNYQANMFNGSYANSYLGKDGFPPYDGDDAAYFARLIKEGLDPNKVQKKWYWPYRDDQLMMKWNDAWLSNKDCNGDGLLDRPDDMGGTYIGSGAWLTNHQSGTYIDDNGNECHWVWFVKIVAAPSGAYKQAGVWYTANGVEIGPVIWGDFAEIQSVYNDPCGGYHGVEYLSPSGPGFGKW